MARYHVHFHGNLLGPHSAKLANADIRLERSHADAREGVMYSGPVFHIVSVEAEDEAGAEQAVKEALGPDAGEFKDWRAAPA